MQLSISLHLAMFATTQLLQDEIVIAIVLLSKQEWRN